MIAYSDSGVSITLTDGRNLSARYAICTFSLGVLQKNDVRFDPAFPTWKTEAIQSMTMVCVVTSQLYSPLTTTTLGDVHQDLPPVPQEVLVRYAGKYYNMRSKVWFTNFWPIVWPLC